MTEHDHEQEQQLPRVKPPRKRLCLIAVGAILLLLLVLFIIILILSLTVFKPKQPTTQLQSAKLDGIAPRVSFPAIDIQLNLTLDLQILVGNRNHASFKHGSGKSLLLYQGNQVGEADIYPGMIPARGSTVLPCQLTLQLDEIASNLSGLIKDVLDGELVMETRTRIPGRVNFLGIFKKHIVATSECRFTVAVLAMKIQKQECRSKAKL